VDRKTCVPPAHDLLHQNLRDELLAEERSENRALEELGQEAVLKLSEVMEHLLRVFASLSHQEVSKRCLTLLSLHNGHVTIAT